MLPPIHIDTMDLSEQFMLNQKHIDDLKDAVVKTVTKVVETSWRNQAKKSLGSTRSQYMNSIIVGEAGRFANVITLVGTLPNMIEQGIDPFDMKKGFEDSSKKVITKNKDGALGWYLTIPFTFAQPTSLGESQTFTGVLPSEVSNILKGKQKKEGQKAKLTLSDIPDEFKVPQMRPEVTLGTGELIPEYKHKHSIYEGISQPKKGGAVMSFRRVSNNSDDNSWIHTGISAHNLAEKAIDDAKIPEVVGDVIDSFLDQVVGQ
jgi:hypothetical protein